MVRGREWTGFEAAALQEAMRRSVRDFAALLGLETTTVANWRSGLSAVVPRSNTQAILDTTYQSRASDDDRARFEQILAEGEATWRDRHRPGIAKRPKPVQTAQSVATTVERSLPTSPGGTTPTEVTDMDRRELLRLSSIATTTLAMPTSVDRATASGHVDIATVDECAVRNRALWQLYGESETKASVFGAVRSQLGLLIEGLRGSRTATFRDRQHELIADVLQLAGEILMDGTHLSEAAHCYALSGTFAARARAYDLWACALTRHAYIGIMDSRFSEALPLVDRAASIAVRGDRTLPTTHWVASVRAQVLAGLGDAHACEQAFDTARGVLDLRATPTLGWLRFSGERIEEEHAGCLIQLDRPERAEHLLRPLLDRPLSPRRRAGVLIDLAAAGALRDDPVQTAWFGGAAVDIARRTRSGYIGRRLDRLGERLSELRGDRHVDYLQQQITTLAVSHRN
ncbi:hypothetical protein AB0H71_26160 [Nocardia sp. NPDC050697]|uniref:hypothetical protein n=1 Tax=Nocardia sp. NPDC050697 TaxID=3155158 RepID=UPI00340746A1